MKLVNRNAAALLFEKVKALDEQHHNSWRCIYLNLSDKQELQNHPLRSHFVVKTISNLLADADGTIYCCNDGDIFILFQGILRPIIHKLSSHFDGLKPEQLAEQSSDSPFIIFDLSKYWQLFFNLCRVKALQAVNALEESPAYRAYRHTPARPSVEVP